MGAVTTISEIPTFGDYSNGRYVMIPKDFEGRVWFCLDDNKTQQGYWNGTVHVDLQNARNVTIDMRGVSSQDMGALWLDDWRISAKIDA